MSKRRSKQESKAAQRAAAGAAANAGARTQVRGGGTGAVRAKVPASTQKPKPQPVGPARALTFGKQTYLFMGVGFALVLIGLLLMSGGRGTEYAEFNVDEIYSFRRITLAPVVILAGLGVVIFGLFKK